MYAWPISNIGAILARWRRPVASVEALDHLHRAMRAVLYRRTATAIKTARKVGTFAIVVFLIETMSAVGAKRSEYSPDGRVWWLLVKP